VGRHDTDVHDQDPRQIPKTVPGEWFWEFVEDYEYAHRHEFCRGYPEFALGPWELGTAWGRKWELVGPPPKRQKKCRQRLFDPPFWLLQEFPLQTIEECDDEDEDADDDDDGALGALELPRSRVPPSYASLPLPCCAMQ